MATTIKTKHSTTAGNVPSSLETGELAINVADGNLFYGDGTGVSQDFAVNTITAQKYIVSSSVTYMTQSFSSGSTAFGDSADDTHTFTGNITASGDISASGTITANSLTANSLTVDNLSLDTNAISSTGDSDVFVTIDTSGFDFEANAGDKFIFNSSNQNNVDFQVSGENDLNLIYVDASEDKVGIGTNTPGEKLEVVGNISASGTITANSFTGNGLSIDGPSNSHIEVGEYAVGIDFSAAFGAITGSGLIISGAMADNNHHNFLKIGNVELVDLNSAISKNEFLIHNVATFKMTSGSDGGDVAHATNELFVHNGHEFFLCKGGEGTSAATIKSTGVATTITDADITLDASNGVSFRAPNVTSGVTHFQGFTADPNSFPQQVKSIAKGNMFTVIGDGGAVTASMVSSSGDLIVNEIKPTKIELEISSTTDGDANGDVVYFGGETGTIAAGEIVHYNSSGNWELANATDTTKSVGLLGVALGGDASADGVLLKGMVTLDHDPGAVGDKLYLRTVAGIAGAAPSGTGNVVRLIGYCLDATNGQIYFNPSNDFIVHA
jgi:hypothetical protein